MFRCFISAEPPGFDYMKNMPESLMQSCIKVANEAPADIKSNLLRAWDKFSQDRIDQSTKPNDFKAVLFALCFFHAVVCGRRRFGPQGWSRKYSFNDGDLTICAQVLFLYIDTNPSVPWEDLRYIFGEIMYGGHITDPWDRTQSYNYLKIYVTEALYNEFELAPGFKAPHMENHNCECIFPRWFDPARLSPTPRSNLDIRTRLTHVPFSSCQSRRHRDRVHQHGAAAGSTDALRTAPERGDRLIVIVDAGAFPDYSQHIGGRRRGRWGWRRRDS